MRVLVADQDFEMLEAVERTFEVDVATSKATCVDLLRANEFDVLVACERLTDGSGLELLSQVTKRWPAVVRILAIEPGRRAQLRGILSPFKLFETINYPIDGKQLEAVLGRVAAAFGTEDEGAARPAATRPAQRPPTPSAPPPRARAAAVSPRPTSGMAPLPVASKFVPLGARDERSFRILPHDYIENEAPLVPRAQRLHPKPPTIHAKAAALAADAVAAIQAAVSRYIRPHATARTTPTPPRKKR
jgi:CheY-like chemotaxis protein